MSSLKHELGITLRNMVQREADDREISRWADDRLRNSDPDQDTKELLERLSLIITPGFGPLSKAEMEHLANLMILNVANIKEIFSPMLPKWGYIFYEKKEDLVFGSWFIVLLSSIDSKQEFLKELASGLDLPEKFRDKQTFEWLDALIWLCDLHWIANPKILFVHDSIPFSHDPAEQKRYFEFLNDVHKAWPGEELGFDKERAIYYAFAKHTRFKLINE